MKVSACTITYIIKSYEQNGRCTTAMKSHFIPRCFRVPARSVICALLVISLVFGGIPKAAAHAPHDIIYIIELSPDFATDQTVFGVVLLSDHQMLIKSTDGGRSWLEYCPPSK